MRESLPCNLPGSRSHLILVGPDYPSTECILSQQLLMPYEEKGGAWEAVISGRLDSDILDF